MYPFPLQPRSLVRFTSFVASYPNYDQTGHKTDNSCYLYSMSSGGLISSSYGTVLPLEVIFFIFTFAKPTYMCVGNELCSKFYFTKHRSCLVYWDILLKYSACDTLKVCNLVCAKIHSATYCRFLNFDLGTKTMSVMEFISVSLLNVIFSLHICFISAIFLAFHSILASIRMQMKPGSRWSCRSVQTAT